MKVLLAGYNIDSETIEELKNSSNYNKENLTPETLSAAYARISRDPRDINILRKESREEVEKSRKSNSTIIFGLGHSSVAEHAFLNFDIIGLSRLAVEEVQKFRLASFTEKSQRYITLEDDYLIPNGFSGEDLELFNETIKVQNSAYHKLYDSLKDYLFNKYSEKVSKKKGKIIVDGWAKEDARYVVSLATLSQFGMSVNARSLENMLRRFSASKLQEVQDLGKAIFEKVNGFAPSIIKYIEKTEYDSKRVENLRLLVNSIPKSSKSSDEVKLVSYDKDIDNKVLASILYEYGFDDYDQAYSYVLSLSLVEKMKLVTNSQQFRKSYNSVCRGYEYGDFTFELLLTATNYAQFKRHRLSSQVTGDYDIDYGVKMPHTIEEAGLKDIFNQVIQKTDETYRKLKKSSPSLADYILTNAHRRKVLVKMNLRELYHFVSLRSDEHAQWDIREISDMLKNIVRDKAPVVSQFLLGKDSFLL
ncbi:MAG: thymidylate synthase (FAD) [Candidatus Cloacimonadota bacterium]|nr:MAG: thymidylate synthase (FAD) [Candidatus Cloacimonadota bacterium]PIE78068.1 MAG: thymidylate synthase (FAD) [Candidatus Delongbacteria bacterium]